MPVFSPYRIDVVVVKIIQVNGECNVNRRAQTEISNPADYIWTNFRFLSFLSLSLTLTGACQINLRFEI